MREIAERPTLADLRDRLHRRKPVSAELNTAQNVSGTRADEAIRDLLDLRVTRLVLLPRVW